MKLHRKLSHSKNRESIRHSCDIMNESESLELNSPNSRLYQLLTECDRSTTCAT